MDCSVPPMVGGPGHIEAALAAWMASTTAERILLRSATSLECDVRNDGDVVGAVVEDEDVSA